jgi:hypothetical protein
MKTPIVLTAYNRPDYFKQVLDSVSSQCWDRKVYCVIDGPRFKEDVDLVKKSFELSKQIIPHCETVVANPNQGVAKIMKYARELVFKDHEFLILIEDDSVLQPHYIQQLDLLIDKFRDDERIAMINCFGEHHRSKKTHKYSYIDYSGEQNNKVSLQEQENNKDKLILMDHLWAYAMRKSSYEKIYDILESYWKLLPQEYRFRPHGDILNLMSSIGADPNKIVSSQDSCTSAAFAARDMIKVSTFTNNFKYIGEVGEHSRPHNFADAGWNDQDLYNCYQPEFEWNENIFNEIKTHMTNKYLK